MREPSPLPNFFYHDRMLSYDFGHGHPLKPERVSRTVSLLNALGQFAPIDPGTGSVDDVLRVHDPEYVEVVRRLSSLPAEEWRREEIMEWAYPFGWGSIDNRPFPGLFEASLAYTAGSAAAARKVNDGDSLAFAMAGGLHHARHAQASGFCTFNDCAVACHILREKFDRVAYVDIDVHHGEGVQWIFEGDPAVLTCSIHESGRSLFPGTGFVTETGAEYSVVNVPLEAGTTGDVWIWAFRNGILPALEKFHPGAIVLQMGADTHYLDPLAHIQSTVADWLEAVSGIRDLGIPLVALGGGGYNMQTVPVMWTAACLALTRQEIPEHVPEPYATDWDRSTFFDKLKPGPAGTGKAPAEKVIEFIRENHLRQMS